MAAKSELNITLISLVGLIATLIVATMMAGVAAIYYIAVGVELDSKYELVDTSERDAIESAGERQLTQWARREDDEYGTVYVMPVNQAIGVIAAEGVLPPVSEPADAPPADADADETDAG